MFLIGNPAVAVLVDGRKRKVVDCRGFDIGNRTVAGFKLSLKVFCRDVFGIVKSFVGGGSRIECAQRLFHAESIWLLSSALLLLMFSEFSFSSNCWRFSRMASMHSSQKGLSSGWLILIGAASISSRRLCSVVRSVRQCGLCRCKWRGKRAPIHV